MHGALVWRLRKELEVAAAAEASKRLDLAGGHDAGDAGRFLSAADRLQIFVNHLGRTVGTPSALETTSSSSVTASLYSWSSLGD